MRSGLLIALAIFVMALPAVAAKPEPLNTATKPAAVKADAPTAKPPSKPAAQVKAGVPALQRADFRVTGASCVACLRRVAQRMRSAPGVIKADVSIFKPYWGLIIYDKKQTTLKQVFDKSVEENVKFADVDDKPIAEMPVILLPKTK